MESDSNESWVSKYWPHCCLLLLGLWIALVFSGCPSKTAQKGKSIIKKGLHKADEKGAEFLEKLERKL